MSAPVTSTYMKVRHEQARKIVITYSKCAARPSHKYGSTGSHNRAHEDATPLTTDALRLADQAMNYRDQCESQTDKRRQLHTERPVMTRWRPRQERRRWMDERTMEGATTQKGFTAQAIATARGDWRVEPSLKDSRRALCSVQRSAVQCAGKLGREHVWRSSRRTRS